MKKAIKSFRDLEVYQLSHEVAMKIFEATKNFPKEEKYSMVDQIRRSSRSVSTNIVEGWGKRKYSEIFKRQLIDSIGSAEETKVWLLFAKDCNYIGASEFDDLFAAYETIGSKLFKLHENWRTFEV